MTSSTVLMVTKIVVTAKNVAIDTVSAWMIILQDTMW